MAQAGDKTSSVTSEALRLLFTAVAAVMLMIAAAHGAQGKIQTGI